MSQSFENLMTELEGIVERLESSDLTLEQAIEAYQKGVGLAQQGHQRLSDAEQRIAELTRSGEKRTVDPSQIMGGDD
ncbi:MAG: exodeoxyribonuclease VII small subunit [Deltaproteobacteria bacterium]|nr:exodeoxyribonuclease VII small subunit [Deltaproteobacteria bacterium]